jgi:hypothetical protein
MAGHARYTALLDACVLYPLAMADALMSLATAGFFAAKWTTRIEDEWIRSLEKERPELVGKLGVRRDSMRDAIPDWEVPETAWSAITRGLELPDPNDVHVLAPLLRAELVRIPNTSGASEVRRSNRRTYVTRAVR